MPARAHAPRARFGAIRTFCCFGHTVPPHPIARYPFYHIDYDNTHRWRVLVRARRSRVPDHHAVTIGFDAWKAPTPVMTRSLCTLGVLNTDSALAFPSADAPLGDDELRLYQLLSLAFPNEHNGAQMFYFKVRSGAAQRRPLIRVVVTATAVICFSRSEFVLWCLVFDLSILATSSGAVGAIPRLGAHTQSPSRARTCREATSRPWRASLACAPC